MCVRLFPDIIVASEISNTIRHIELRSNLNNVYAGEKFMENLNCIYVSVGRCIEQQMIYKHQMDANYTFVGYGDNVWTKDDYTEYFDKHRQFFDLVDEDNLLYRVRIDELCCKSDPDSYGGSRKELSVTEIIKSIRENLLSIDSYSPQVLSYIGL